MPTRRRACPTAEFHRRIFETLPLGLMVWHLETPDDPGTLRLLALDTAGSEALAEVALSGHPRDLGEMVYGDARISEGVHSIFAFPLPDRSVGVAFENVT